MSSRYWPHGFPAKVAAVLEEASEPLTVSEIAVWAGIEVGDASSAISYLVKCRRAEKTGSRGSYRYARPGLIAKLDQLPSIARLPLAGREPRHGVGVVVLLAQNRKAA